tara:strand:+ start:4326 stop:4991 length:666 start_codon:yes stop_codon:yes gene_type:complete
MTPCEKLGYKVGDEFEYTGDVEFDTGDKIVLIDDDGSDQPDFRRENDSLEQYCFLGDVRPLPVTLRKGDYCSTANMTESEYRAVAAAFMAAGSDIKTKSDNNMRRCVDGRVDYLGWDYVDNRMFHVVGEGPKNSRFKRNLTPAQIIGAVNAKTEESNMSEFKTGDKVVLNGHRNDGDDYEAGITPSIERWAREDTVLTVMGDAITPKCHKVTDGKVMQLST